MTTADALALLPVSHRAAIIEEVRRAVAPRCQGHLIRPRDPQPRAADADDFAQEGHVVILEALATDAWDPSRGTLRDYLFCRLRQRLGRWAAQQLHLLSGGRGHRRNAGWAACSVRYANATETNQDDHQPGTYTLEGVLARTGRTHDGLAELEVADLRARGASRLAALAQVAEAPRTCARMLETGDLREGLGRGGKRTQAASRLVSAARRDPVLRGVVREMAA